MTFLSAKLLHHPFRGPALIALTLSLIFTLLLPSIMVQAEIWNAAPQGTFLTPKWVGYVAGGGEALVTYDVNTSVPGEEVFHAGGPPQPSATPGWVTCLRGTDGIILWNVSIFGIGDTATLQMADIEGDGKMEIVVALQSPAGIYILNAEDGSELWKAPGGYTYNGTTIGGFITPIGGRVDGSGVIGDIDGDGYPTVFLGVMAYEEQPDSGKLISWEWDPNQGIMVEQARTRVWHPCAGGLSLGDTDNDGTFELYMNERDAYYGDGSWGRGLTSFWADNLTLRWRIYDWGASSNIPMLADVNKDGVTDVVSTNLGTGICVLNSTDGHPLTGAGGVVLYNPQLGLPVHYQSSIYDIDGDGNLELMCADGTHVATGMGFISNYTMIWDLYDWHLDGVINAGLCFRGPSVGEVTGDGAMDIIVATYDESGNNSDAVKIYDKNYNLVEQFVGLRRPVIGSVVQDVDRNDGGLNELLVVAQGGVIYCFDTPGLASNPRARSEIHFYSESRNGASEYIPYERPNPDVISPNPTLGTVNVSTSLSQLVFRLNHPLNQTMNYTVTTSPNIGSGNGTNVGNGERTVSVSGLSASTLYSWQVNATDQSGHRTSRTYWFNTAPYITNTAPTQGTPILNSTHGGNSLTEDLTCYNQSTADVNANKVTNVYNWLKNGAPLANLNLPFETNPDAAAVYSGYAATRDYSGLGNHGTVFGATWTQGVVGGAFSFDGNDFIRMEEQGNSLGGDGSWSQIAVECWIKVTETQTNKPVIWKTDRYLTSDIGYRLDVSANLTGSQLDYIWYIYTPSGALNVTCTLNSNADDWHHVVCTYKSGEGLKIYVDGSQRANSGATAAGNINPTDGPLEIAFNSAIDFSTIVDYPSYLAAIRDFTGVLDEVRVYSFEVPASYVVQRYLDTKDGLSSKSTLKHSLLYSNDRWTCQVTPNDGLTDGPTISSNIIRVSASVVFADGFESGDFQAWTGNTTTTGGSVGVSSSPVYSGSYSGQFNITSGAGTRRAYCYVNLENQSTMHSSSEVYIGEGLSLSSGQTLWLVQFADSGGNALGSYGIRADATGTHWALQYAGWPYALAAADVPAPTDGTWYAVDTFFTHSSTGKTLTLQINGVEVASLNQNTSAANAITDARFGEVYWSGASAVSVCIDDVSIYTESTPSTQPDAYLVVRGQEGAIYYKPYDVESSTWQSWRSVPDGLTPDTPAAAVCQGKLYTVVRSMDGNSLWMSSTDLTDSSFSGWTNIEGSTPSAPTLVSNGTHLFLIVRGMDDIVYMRTYSCLSSTWGSWIALPGSTCDTVGAAVLGTNLHLVVRGTSDNMVLWHGYVALSDMSFSGWSSLAGGSDVAPTLATCADLDSIYLCVKGEDGLIYINKWTAGTWQGWNALSSGSTMDTPAAVAINETLQILVRGSDGYSLWHCSVDLSTQLQTAWTIIDGSTTTAPTLTT